MDTNDFLYQAIHRLHFPSTKVHETSTPFTNEGIVLHECPDVLDERSTSNSIHVLTTVIKLSAFVDAFVRQSAKQFRVWNGSKNMNTSWTERHTSHVVFSHWFTRTCVAQVACLSCAHHVSSSCVCSDSLRLLRFPLSAHHLLSYHLVLPLAHQLHLPRCGGQNSLCTLANENLGTLAEYDPLTGCEPNDFHITEATEPYIQESSVENGSTNDFRVRWRHHRQGALFTSVHIGARRRCEP